MTLLLCSEVVIRGSNDLLLCSEVVIRGLNDPPTPDYVSIMA